MTKLHQEKVLQDLYQQAKKQDKLPHEVTSKVLNYARKKSNPLAFMMRWQTVAAAFLVVFVWMGLNTKQTPSYSITSTLDQNNERIYYHDVSFKVIESSREERNLDASRTAYLNSLAKLDDASELSGIVKKAGDSVVVEICQVGLVQLSPKVLKQLGNDRVIEQLRVGQSIQLASNDKGMFVAINQTSVTNDAQCAE